MHTRTCVYIYNWKKTIIYFISIYPSLSIYMCVSCALLHVRQKLLIPNGAPATLWYAIVAAKADTHLRSFGEF